MNTKNYVKKDENINIDIIIKTASKMQIRHDDRKNLVYIIYDSLYSKKLRKINRNRQKIKTPKTSVILDNVEK